MAYTKDTPLVDNSTDTQLLGRSVHADIKDMIEQSCLLTYLTKEMSVDKSTGAVTQKKGAIDMVMRNQSRVEVFTHTPKTVEQTCGAVTHPGTSDSTVVLANAATQIVPKMVFQNSANDEIGMVDSISGTDVDIDGIGADFFPTEGDVLVYLGTNVEYGSSVPGYTSNTDDNHYNVMGIFRFPIETTLSAKDSGQNAGGNLFNRYKKYEVQNGVQAFERSMIFGKRAASGNTTTMTTLGVAVPTARGLYDMAQSTYAFGGNITFEKIFKNLYLQAHDSMDMEATYIWLLGKQAHAEILSQMSENTRVIRENDGNVYKKWGVKADTIITPGFNLALKVHNAFNKGSNTSKGLILDPEDLIHNYKNGEPPRGKNGKAMNKGRNWNIIENTESNGDDKKRDELFIEACYTSKSGGYSLMTTTGLI